MYFTVVNFATAFFVALLRHHVVTGHLLRYTLFRSELLCGVSVRVPWVLAFKKEPGFISVS